MPDTSHLEIVALGGLGEFGMNLMVYRWGEDCLIVDAGMMFPGMDHLGIDVVVPDLSFLDDCGTLHGVILTHGHEDHIGALPYLLARHDIPVFATPHTLELIRNRLAEHDRLSQKKLSRLPEDRALELGPFQIESLAVAHSIPQARMLVLRTPVGVVVHTADFKIDPDPVHGRGTDLGRLAQLGQEGVLLLLSDSTNADRPGSTPGERSVAPAIDRAIAGQSGRVVVTTFASHIDRVQQLVHLAEKHGRRIACCGSSLETHVDVAESLGLLRLPPGLRVPAERIMELEPSATLVIAAGSQGEPLSAMARIAAGKHRHLRIEPGDLVIHSAREIPGNQKSIARLVNNLMRGGAEVLTAADAQVHVSGHASEDELRLLLQLVRPRFFVPIHGEYRQLRAHARLAAASGVLSSRLLLAESGDVITVNDQEIRISDRVRVGQTFIGGSADEIDPETVNERRRLAGDGIVVPVVAVDRDTGALNGLPEIMTRGFLPLNGNDNALMIEARQIVVDALACATREERTDERLLRARIESELKRFVRRRTQRQPLIIPVIVEL